MGWLAPITGWIRRRIAAPHGQERGAVSALVAVLLAGGVVMAVGGRRRRCRPVVLRTERLQTGADAAAMAVARACAAYPVHLR
jgi:hypothetical protein